MAGANFGSTSITSSQLYSTASYSASNLQGIKLGGINLTGWNFAGQNLAGAWFYSSTLTNANFTNANLTNASLYSSTLTNANFTNANLVNANLSGATLGNANFTAVDLRGATGFVAGSATTTNAILPNGTIQGLSLNAANPLLVVHDYSGSTPIPIQINSGMTVGSGGTLQTLFDGPTWGSTISFASVTPVSLGGSLELGVAPSVNPVGLVGDTFQLFNWTGASVSGTFAQIVSDLPARFSWNTSALYTSGQVSLAVSTTINGQWASNGSGTWSGSANWSGGNEPGAPQDAAVFGAALTGGTAAVTLDGSRSLSSLGFSTTGGASYTIAATNGATLTLANTAGSATISDSGGNHTIAVPITLASNLSVTASTGSALAIAGGISDGGSGLSLSFSGGGELILSGTDAYSGGTNITGGTLDIAAASALPTSGLVAISGGGRLVLGSGTGIGALLTASSPISSDAVALSAAASAPATISGSENTSEDMATLGGAPPLSLGGGGSAVASSAAAVPEPGTMVLLAAAVLMLAIARWRRRG